MSGDGREVTGQRQVLSGRRAGNPAKGAPPDPHREKENNGRGGNAAPRAGRRGGGVGGGMARQSYDRWQTNSMASYGQA